MAIDFPNSPALNDTYTIGNITWTYDGSKWKIDSVSGGGTVNLSNSNPLMNGVAEPGDNLLASRDDHVHPVDTSRAPIDSPNFTGTPTVPTPILSANNTVAVNAEFVVGQGYLKSSNAATTYQPLDADLTSIAGIAETSGYLKKTAADTWAVSGTIPLSDITGTVGVSRGGTGLTTVAAGAILYASALDTVTGLTVGTNNQVLTSNGTVPLWTTSTGTGNIVRATSPTFATSVVGGATMAVFNTTSTTVNAFGAGTTINIGGTPTTAVTATILGNATATGVTKTVNIGTSGASGSTTNINIGSSVSGAITNIVLRGIPTAATAAVDTNTTQLATTEFVIAQGYLKSADASSTYLTISSASSSYQPLDSDLTAIAALSGSGVLNRDALGAWSFETPGDYLTVANAALTYQPLDGDLTTIAGLTGTGWLKRTGTNTWTFDNPSDYLTTADASTTYLTISNASSTYLTQANASSNYQPLDGDLTAIAALTGNGVLNRTGTNTWELIVPADYLTVADAASTYLTIANAASTYLTSATAASTYLSSATAATTYAPLASPAFTGTPTTTYQRIIPTGTKPTFNEGNLFYHNEEKTVIIQGSNGFEIPVGQREWTRVRNGTASTIPKGSVVYAVGVHIAGDPIHGHHVSIDLADASDINKIDVLGIAAEDILAGDHGYVVVRGHIENMNTAGLTEGDRIHLSATVPGGLVASAPTYPNYPVDVGRCLTSSATVGGIYVDIQPHTIEGLRVTGNGYVDGNFTVGGDLSILGSSSSISTSNLSVANNFIYLNSGDTIGAAGTAFTGSGLDDATLVGHYTGTTTKTFKVKIVATGPDRFRWSTDNFATDNGSDITITAGVAQALSDNISVEFVAGTGHTVNDIWSGTAAPLNVDLALIGNRNTGTTGVGYTHTGLFFDVSDAKFKVFDEYDPEPVVNIDTAHASFALATLVAETFEGNLIGEVTGNVNGNITGNAATVTNGVYTTGSYANPSWITSLAWSKISSTPTTLSGYGISDAQPLDADLSAIAALTGTSGFLKKTAADTWVLDTSTYLTSSTGVTSVNGSTGAVTGLAELAGATFTGLITSSKAAPAVNLTGAPSATASTNALLNVGSSSWSDTDILASFTHTVNSYSQVVIQNKSTGATASADLVISNDTGSAAANYVDLGMNSSNFTGSGPWDDPNGGYLYVNGGSLAVGTQGANSLEFVTGDEIRATLDANGTFTIPTSASGTVNALTLSGTPSATLVARGLLQVGSTVGYTDVNMVASFVGDIDDYSQVVVQNKNAGTSASADFIVNNNISTATNAYGDFGINSSNYAVGSVFDAASSVYLYSNGSDLAIGTRTAHSLYIGTNDEERLAITDTEITSTIPLLLPASTSIISSLNIPHGVAPTTPVNGDIWTTTEGMFVRVNGSTKGPFATMTSSASVLPASGFAGQLHYTTIDAYIYKWTGSAWENIANWASLGNPLGASAWGVLYAGSAAVSTTSAGTAGQVLTSQGGVGLPPTWTDPVSLAANNTFTAFNTFNAANTTSESTLTVNSASWLNGTATGYGLLRVGDPVIENINLIASFNKSLDSYVSTVFQNSNAGTTASVDLVFQNNLTTTAANSVYGDIGLSSSNYVGTGFSAANQMYMYMNGGALAVGTISNNPFRVITGTGQTERLNVSGTGLFTFGTGTRLVLPQHTTAASLNLTPGTGNPSSPVDGDVWINATGMYARINNATVGPFSAGGAGASLTAENVFTDTNTFSLSTTSTPAAEALKPALYLSGLPKLGGSFSMSTGLLQVGPVVTALADTNIVGVFSVPVNDYSQTLFINSDTGNQASVDICLYNDQTLLKGGLGSYADIGLSSSTYTTNPSWPAFSDPGGMYIYMQGGSMTIGTQHVGDTAPTSYNNDFGIATDDLTRVTLQGGKAGGVSNWIFESNLNSVIFNTTLISNNHRTANTAATSTNSAAITIQTGNATGTTSSSGSITIDTGTGTTTAGDINIGTTNAKTITIGSTSATSGMAVVYPAAGTAATATVSAGYMGMPQITYATGTAHTLAFADAGKHIYFTTGTNSVAIPANGTAAFPIGTTVVIANASATSASVTITTDTLRLAGTGVTGTRTIAQYGMATLLKVTATEWWISGNGVA